jgi:hypothetical protein
MPVPFTRSDPWHLKLAKATTLLSVYAAYAFLFLMVLIVLGVLR